MNSFYGAKQWCFNSCMAFCHFILLKLFREKATMEFIGGFSWRRRWKMHTPSEAFLDSPALLCPRLPTVSPLVFHGLSQSLDHRFPPIRVFQIVHEKPRSPWFRFSATLQIASSAPCSPVPNSLVQSTFHQASLATPNINFPRFNIWQTSNL